MRTGSHLRYVQNRQGPRSCDRLERVENTALEKGRAKPKQAAMGEVPYTPVKGDQRNRVRQVSSIGVLGFFKAERRTGRGDFQEFDRDRICPVQADRRGKDHRIDAGRGPFGFDALCVMRATRYLRHRAYIACGILLNRHLHAIEFGGGIRTPDALGCGITNGREVSGRFGRDGQRQTLMSKDTPGESSVGANRLLHDNRRDTAKLWQKFAKKAPETGPSGLKKPKSFAGMPSRARAFFL